MPPKPSFPIRQILLLTSGDFACNLYWQTLSFFLFFYYTDVLGVPPGSAGLVLALGAVVDGVGAMLVGGVAERSRSYCVFVRRGAVPLGLAFCAMFIAPPLNFPGRLAVIGGAHLAFRALYAIVNIPYVALGARLTNDSATRARIAAGRMLFGTAAAVVVAVTVRSLARRPDGRLTAAGGYAGAAILFAILGTVVLLAVSTLKDGQRTRQSLGRWPYVADGRALGNRALITLLLASAAVTVGGGAVNGSVLFYCTNVARAPLAGPVAVAWMGMAGAVAVPCWMIIRDRFGTRAMWLGNAVAALLVIASFVEAGVTDERHGIIYLIAIQITMTGFSFAFWSMLPDTIEWGEHATGVRVEALVFGIAALTQKLALGGSALLLGVAYDRAGMADAVRLAMVAAPAVAVATSGLAMLANPLRRDTHARITGALAARAQAAASSNVP